MIPDSPCHDHNGSECFMRMVEGHLVEVRYAWPAAGADQSQPLKIISQTTLTPGSVCFINGSCHSLSLCFLDSICSYLISSSLLVFLSVLCLSHHQIHWVCIRSVIRPPQRWRSHCIVTSPGTTPVKRGVNPTNQPNASKPISRTIRNVAKNHISSS